LLEDLQRMAPYGPGNPEPMLALPDVRAERAKVLRGGHIRCSLAGERGTRLEAIAWRAEDSDLGRRLLGGDGGLHVAGRLRANDWNGRVGVQLEIEDVADPRRVPAA
jgi:single-stranded-DNA-specific exonuclease